MRSENVTDEILYSYLMEVQAIDQYIFPEVLDRPKCSIAQDHEFVFTNHSKGQW